MKKPLETVWVGPHDRWGRVSRNHQGWANYKGQVDGDTDMATTCQLHMGRVLEKEQ